VHTIVNINIMVIWVRCIAVSCTCLSTIKADQGCSITHWKTTVILVIYHLHVTLLCLVDINISFASEM
jgi:hypothetical protein